MASAVVLVAALAGGAGATGPSRIAPGDTPRLLAVVPAGPDSLPVLDVSVAVPYRWLVFHREGGRFQATARLTVTALREGLPVGGDVVTRRAVVDTERAAWSRRPLRLVARVVIPDTLPVRLHLTVQGVGSRRRWERELPVVPGRLVRSAWRLVEATWETRPPGRILAARGDSLWLRLRLVPVRHRPARLDLAAVPTATGDTLVLARRGLPAAGADTLAVTLAAAAADLPFGEHELVPRLDGAPLPGVAPLDLFDLVVHWWDDVAWQRQVAWLDGIVDRAGRDSLRRLPPPQRPAAWRRVWAVRPAESHPTEREHLLRIVVADRRFGGMGRGAESDRGRVFIELGEPDRVEQYADERNYPARWEIWYYERLGVAYRFYDAFGLGDYRFHDTVPI